MYQTLWLQGMQSPQCVENTLLPTITEGGCPLLHVVKYVPYTNKVCSLLNKRGYKTVMAKFEAQSQDETTDELLELSDEALGILVRESWISGQHIAFKRMLQRRHKSIQKINIHLFSMEEMQALMERLEREIRPHQTAQAAGRQAEYTLQTPDESSDNIVFNPPPNTSGSFEAQSADEIMTLSGGGESDTTKQNVEFLDSDSGPSWSMDNIPRGIEDYDSTPGVDLSEFLSRPVLIKTLAMSLSDTTATTAQFTPWSLYFATAEIQRKLHNYAFFRCNLKIKVVFNASPFYYGAYMLSYKPLSGHTTTHLGANPKIPYSQRPHMWLMPQSCAGAEMTLPFFYHKPWLETSTAARLVDFGEFTYLTYVPLKSANGASGTGSDVQVQIFAWAEDVHLSAPTYGLAAQTGDEYSGAVSAPASAMATYLGKLGTVPIIGHYATASSQIARGIGNLAALLGFTNVPNVGTVNAVKPGAFPGLCSTEISVPTDKLSMDPKCELTIDPNSVGLPSADELSIAYINQKESFLTIMNFNNTNIVGDILFCSLVQPNLCEIYVPPATSFPQYNMVPMGYISQLFDNWRGDIIFKFRAICTKYHKGRLKISYDPNYDISTTVPSFPTAFTYIWDVSDAQVLEITVPYNQATAWLRAQKIADAPLTKGFSISGSALTRNIGRDNGMLQLSVLTTLSAPIADADVQIMVSVYGAPNLEYAYPVDPPQNQTLFTVQTQDEIKCEDEVVTVVAGHKNGVQAPQRYLLNFGENIVSLRQLLRRSTYSTTVALPLTFTTTNMAIFRHQCGVYPQYFGYNAAAPHTATGIVSGTSQAFAFVKTMPYNWLAPMYIAQRGSVIWHNNLDTSISGQLVHSVKTTRLPASYGASDYSSMIAVGATVAAATPSTLANFFTTSAAGASGQALTNQATNTGVSVSIPFYSQFKFHFTNPSFSYSGGAEDGSSRYAMRTDATLNATNGNIRANHLDKYFSIGSDFTFFFFQGVPGTQTLSGVVPI